MELFCRVNHRKLESPVSSVPRCTLRLVALRTLSFQVDSSETLSDSDAEGKALTEVHSIGVQVEDDKR